MPNINNVIILPRHKEKLNSGKVKVVAQCNSHIEGAYMRGDILTVYATIGSMLRVRNEKGRTSMIKYDKVLYASEIIDEVVCEYCGSLDINKHKHGCSVTIEEDEE